MPLGTSGPKVEIDTNQAVAWLNGTYSEASGKLTYNGTDYYLCVGQDANEDNLVSRLVKVSNWAAQGRPRFRLTEAQFDDIVAVFQNQGSPIVELTDADMLVGDGC